MVVIPWPEEPETGSTNILLIPPTGWTHGARYEAQAIVPRIFLGPYQLVKSEEFINRYGVTHALCIRDPSEVRLLNGARSVVPNIEFVDVPANVARENIIPVFNRVNEWIKQTVDQGFVVLVCCSDGIDKSASFVAAYLMKRYQISAEGAISFVQSTRYCAMPSPQGYRIKLLEYEPICAAVRDYASASQSENNSSNSRRRSDDDDDNEGMVPESDPSFVAADIHCAKRVR